MGQVPKKNNYAEKMEEDLNFTTRFGEFRGDRTMPLMRYLISVMIFQQLSLSYNTNVSGDNHVTNLSR